MREKFEQLLATLKSKLPSGIKNIIWRDTGNIEEEPVESAVQKSKASIKQEQFKNLALVIITIIVVIGLAVSFSKKGGKGDVKQAEGPESAIDSLEIEVASKDLDGEKMWRNYFEDELKSSKKNQRQELEKAIAAISSKQAESKDNQERQIANLLAELKIAREELGNASAELQAVARERAQEAQYIYPDVNMSLENYSGDVVYDEPKSADNYIPAGTYFNGYLLGGIAVSTALNAPNENATPVILRLTSGGNLDKESKLDVKRCRITGSAYGDLSSERAIIRLEQLVCKQDGMWLISNIAGLVYGADGMTGIKGKVIETSGKHLQNAAIGGLVSGFSNSVKGQDSMAIISGSALTTKSKGLKGMATDGALSGLSSAGEKLADYYLRQAERMSPVLTIPGGVKINATITKGFHIGQLNTHEKIKKERKRRSSNYSQQLDDVRNQAQNEYESAGTSNLNNLNDNGENNANSSALPSW